MSLGGVLSAFRSEPSFDSPELIGEALSYASSLSTRGSCGCIKVGLSEVDMICVILSLVVRQNGRVTLELEIRNVNKDIE